MESEPKYQLVIWFDQEQVDMNALFRFANNSLTANVEKKVGYSTEGYLTLSIEGVLEAVDKGHSEIIDFIEKTNRNFFRLKDTAGDEIRRRAYTELSTIEQELRAFINRGLIEIWGFDWWGSLGAMKIPGIETPQYRKTHHPLELMTIEELINLVLLEKSEWDDENPILLKDLTTILDGSNSFDEFRAKLIQKAKKISLWELVFSKYLGENAPMWQEIRKKDLQFIIDLRNSVMHHRPVRFGELKALDEKRKKISSFIASAKTQLSDDEKKEIATLQKGVRDIFAQLVYERAAQNAYGRLYDSLKKSRNTVTVRNLIDEIAALTATGGLNTKESLELRAVTFDQLQTLTDYKLDETQDIILNELLPLCLHEDAELPMQYSAFRNILADWIANHPEHDSITLRNLVLDKLLGPIGTSNHKTACWTISRMGFAREDVILKLLDFAVKADDESGDDTLFTLTWLSFSQDQRKVILDELHRRAGKRYSNSLVWSLARLGEQASLPIILNEWLQADKITEKGVDASIAFTAIREIANASDDDTALQDAIWKETSNLVEQNHQTLRFPFDVGHLVTTCNSALVVPTLLRWHGQHPEWFQNPDWARYLAQERLEESVKPLQLEGWSRIDDKAIFNALQKDACGDSGNDIFASTEESILKESAWKTVLRAGYPDALTWFEPAVANETGRFIRQKVMEYLAAFRIEPLPEAAVRWITEEFNDTADGNGRELSYRMAAVRLARSLASVDAFEVLLNFGFTYKGKVLEQSAEAVVGVALALLRQGHTEVVERLALLATNSDVKRQRLVAVNALEVIATFPEYHPLLIPHREQFIPAVYEEKRENVERGQLLNIIAYLPDDIPEALEKDLVVWAREPDRWFGGGSLQVLARHGKLETHLELMQDILNIEKDGNGWKLSAGEIRYEWAPYMLGILYHQTPQVYVKVVGALIETGDWQAVIQILEWIRVTHGSEGQPKLPDEIRNALFRRITSKLSRIYSETETFDSLSNLAPDVLVNDTLVKVMPAWMPDSRIALANALRKAKVSTNLPGQSIAILESLTEDSMYSVRRSAYRAIARHSAAHLYKLCQSWLESPIFKLNLRSAEACGWIEGVTNTEGQDVFEELKELCFSHPESKVREAFKRSWEERRRRQWAKTYLEKVVIVEGKSNDEILQTWRYGDALNRVGDDETRELLREHLLSKQLPPNVRFWISKHILEPLENNWKKVTQKWPELWVDSRGAIQRGEGKLIVNPDKVVGVQYSIWLNPAATPAEKHSWGGTMIIFWGDVLNLDQAVLELEDGRRGDILLSGIIGNTTTFIGIGGYPT